MLSMKSVASALVLAATAADFAAPILVVPAIALAVSTMAHAAPAAPTPVLFLAQASQPAHAG